MYPTIAQNTELLKHLEALIEAHRPIFRQERIYQRIQALVVSLKGVGDGSMPNFSRNQGSFSPK